MATAITAKVTGETQGAIEGALEQAGREGTTEVLQFSHGIASATDYSSGRTIGKRTHQPIALTCKTGKETPLYLNALVNNERLSEVVITFYHTDKAGKEVVFYTVKLTNAAFSDVTMSSDNGGSFDVATYLLAYQKIEWEWADGNIMAADDWLTPT